VSVTTSAGVCALASCETANEALARATIALNAAKEDGRNRMINWAADDEKTALRAATLDWSTRIKDALDEDRFVVYLQPIVELATGKVAQYEALARLRQPDDSIAPPAAFIPAAGRLGLMPALDRAILGKVVALLERDPSLRICMNLDAASFAEDSILDAVEQLAARPDLTGRLGIEITEHTSLRDTERANRRLERLKELNCIVALDDFGTGFASFKQLRDLPAHLVKISSTFVSHLDDEDSSSASLVNAIVTVARALGKRVVAEGVETAEGAEALKAYDIRYAQGYFFGRPAPAESILAEQRQPVALLQAARQRQAAAV
jgi:EAL domain-containing protein (putative c-di-GMP-specific phosphodiesterase class I)